MGRKEAPVHHDDVKVLGEVGGCLAATESTARSRGVGTGKIVDSRRLRSSPLAVLDEEAEEDKAQLPVAFDSSGVAHGVGIDGERRG